MRFKEFLDKLGNEIAEDEQTDFNTFKRIERNLGEWAWKEAWGKKWELNDDRFEVYREIAIDCFGEEEIKKKLKELK